MSNSLLIIDAHAVLHRAFHALPPLTNKQREPVGAVFGFFSVLLSTLKKIKPRKLAICFDSPGPTFRHKLFIGYQSKRPITEDRLVSQIKKTRKLVAESGLAYFIKSGFEADDLVASLAKKNQASKIYILTGDKDLMQLVDKKVNLLLMGRQMNKLTKVNSQEVKKNIRNQAFAGS
ncbi:MAG: PIN domain-containing protein [Candidatus Shapirobacteria bacterium]